MDTAIYIAFSTLVSAKVTELPIMADQLEAMIKAEGYKIYAYNLYNPDDVVLLESLKILGYAKYHDGFTYNLKQRKIVFYRHNISEESKRGVLSHELAHIKCNHLAHAGILGYTSNGYVDEEQEIEADTFRSALLAPSCVLRSAKINKINAIKKHTLVCDSDAIASYNQCNESPAEMLNIEISLCEQFHDYIRKILRQKFFTALKRILIILILLILPLIFIGTIKYYSNTSYMLPPRSNVNQTTSPANSLPTSLYSEEILSREVVVTKTGSKFHVPDCRYVRNKSDLSTVTIKDALDQNLDPCMICEPMEEN